MHHARISVQCSIQSPEAWVNFELWGKSGTTIGRYASAGRLETQSAGDRLLARVFEGLNAQSPKRRFCGQPNKIINFKIYTVTQ